MDILKVISEEMTLKFHQVQNTVSMLEEGDTVPFISRYRKERTGNLNEEEIRRIEELFKYYTNLESYKQTVINSISEQGKLTEELRKEIENALKLSIVEDIYLPYKKRKKTKADMAIQAGLEPLAIMILQGMEVSKSTFNSYFSDEYPVLEKAEEGVVYIIGQKFSHDQFIRDSLRNFYTKSGFILSQKKKEFKEQKTKYDMYDDFKQEISKIQDYRILALDRGEKEDVLSISLSLEEVFIEQLFSNYMTKKMPNDTYIKTGLEYGFKNMLDPSISREIRQSMSEKAGDAAIELFAKNLRELLMTPPLKNKRVLAIDPGFRTGCKAVALDESGKFLEYNTIFPVPPQNDFEGAEKTVLKMIKSHNLNLIVIGNGTASRETQAFVVNTIKSNSLNIKYIFANEAGASVYSASEIAKEEFPDQDVTVRGAVSIGRRVQDPLAELVKIDPKSIGVGQYQHDVNQKKLKEKLENTVESVVNTVGVNLNTSSYAILSFISGINSSTAKKIVEYRNKNGKFLKREALMNVKGFGQKAFEQSAGFLRIFDGSKPLEVTGIHPESYGAAQILLKELGYSASDILDPVKSILLKKALSECISNDKKLSEYEKKLGVGKFTLSDIIKELQKPGIDPRDELTQPILYDDILSFNDLKEGMKLQGKITNITDFGAFVDLGIKESGLIHKSNMGKKFVRHPSEVLSINDIVNIEIITMDKELKRINLRLV
ncbi:MAG: RNA-binding transcriptional accessory protein [Petrotogaceae bacterium]|nr:RNA-binding transcriptional accessory protein [Petrotogaceae bacterium]